MTTPTSSLGMSHIQTEFGGSNPISLSEYYGVNANVAVSGAIRMAQFLGIANYAASHPNVNLLDSVIDPDNAAAIHQVFLNGTYQGEVSDLGVVSSGTWKTGGGTGANYDVQLIRTDGAVPTGDSTNTWLNLATSRSWTVSRTTIGLSEMNGYLLIRVAGGATLSNSTVYMGAEIG
jgi:hypothetical protein